MFFKYPLNGDLKKVVHAHSFCPAFKHFYPAHDLLFLTLSHPPYIICVFYAQSSTSSGHILCESNKAVLKFNNLALFEKCTDTNDALDSNQDFNQDFNIQFLIQFS